MAVNKVKIKKSELKQIIKEELEATIDESILDKIMGRKEVDNQALIYSGPNAIKVTKSSLGDIPKQSLGLGKNPVGLGLTVTAFGKVNLTTPKGQRPEDKLKPNSATVNVRYKAPQGPLALNPDVEFDFNPIKLVKNKGVPQETRIYGPSNANKDVAYLLKQLENLNADGFMMAYDGPGGFKTVTDPEDLAKQIYLDFAEKFLKFAKRRDDEIIKHLEVAKQQLGV